MYLQFGDWCPIVMQLISRFYVVYPITSTCVYAILCETIADRKRCCMETVNG